MFLPPLTLDLKPPLAPARFLPPVLLAPFFWYLLCGPLREVLFFLFFGLFLSVLLVLILKAPSSFLMLLVTACGLKRPLPWRSWPRPKRPSLVPRWPFGPPFWPPLKPGPPF